MTSSSNRATLLTKTHKVLKKHYTPVSPPADRALLEHLLYGCCLENAKHEAADEAFARLQQQYFDWNEVRVTTVTELSEVLSNLPDPAAAAARLKRTLQSVFETHYSFDLEFLRKENLGKAQKKLEQYDGVDPFAVAYVTQAGLGGHAIPLGEGAFRALIVLGVANPGDAEKRYVSGLERAISKNKGVEFGSLLHQFGVDFAHSPFSTRVRAIFVEIDPEAKDRLPKRTKKEGEPEEAPVEAESSRKALKKKEAGKAAPEKTPASEKATPEKPEKKKAAKAEEEPKKPAPKKAAPSAKKSTPAKATKKTSSKGLSKKKPR